MEWEYKVIGYGKDSLPQDVSVFRDSDLRRFTRAFVQEFQAQMHHYDFHDLFVGLMVSYDTGVFETDDKSRYSVTLKVV